MIAMAEPTLETRLARVGLTIRAGPGGRLTLESLAASAGFSPFHFHRIFRVAYGETLSVYVTRHRLEGAARDLRGTPRTIVDIALAHGYESASAFGRAFARAYGMTPSAYRASGGAPLAPPAFEAMPEPRIVSYEPEEAFALAHVGPYDRVDGVMRRAYEAAARLGLFPASSIAAMSFDSPDLAEHDALRFFACVTNVPSAHVATMRAAGFAPATIPGGRYAVFRHRGPYERITHAYDRIVAAWVLTERVVLRDGPFVNRYLSRPDRTRSADLECDLAIPVL